MKICMERFQKQLLALYASDPSRYTPFAMWKMQKMTAEGEAFYLPEYDCYYAIRDKQLLFYSTADRKCHIPIEELNELELIVMNHGIFDPIKDQLTGFELSYGWTLYYDFHYQAMRNPVKKYEVIDFDFTDEEHYQTAADIINGDADGGFHPQRIRKWTTFPSFDPSLWFFIRDRETQKLMGIGISTFHKQVKETDLDWIFISPAYQGKGAGTFLIHEIIQRSANRSQVIRVGGAAEFYKKCGFFEKERWGWAVKPGFRLKEQ